MFVSLPSVSLSRGSKTLGVHAPETPTAHTSGVCYQGCGAGTQISGVDSRHLDFWAPAPTFKKFLAPDPE